MRSDPRQWASHSVKHEDTNFACDDGSEERGESKMRPRGEQWNREDTYDEKSPHDSMAELYGCQGTHDIDAF